MPAVIEKLGEDYGADGHIDADAESIGSAVPFQQSLLSELFRQRAVFWRQSCMVDGGVVAEQLFHLFPVGIAEIHTDEDFSDGFLPLLGAEESVYEILGGLGAGELGKENEVNGCAIRFDQLPDLFL